VAWTRRNKVSKSDRGRTILSLVGEVWIDLEANSIGLSLDNGPLSFRRNGKCGLLDTAGRVAIAPGYDALTPLYGRGVA
jgi:hypothetical protein